MHKVNANRQRFVSEGIVAALGRETAPFWRWVPSLWVVLRRARMQHVVYRLVRTRIEGGPDGISSGFLQPNTWTSEVARTPHIIAGSRRYPRNTVSSQLPMTGVANSLAYGLQQALRPVYSQLL